MRKILKINQSIQWKVIILNSDLTAAFKNGSVINREIIRVDSPSVMKKS